MYMEITQGIRTKGVRSKTHVLKLLKNLYVKRQRYMVWSQHLTKEVEEIGFQNSRVDDCVFYIREIVFIVYVDAGIFAFPSDTAIDQAITDIGSKFDIEYQGSLNDCIRINIESLPDDKFNIFQPQLIDQIVQDMNLTKMELSRSTPSNSNVILKQDLSAPLFGHNKKGTYTYRKFLLMNSALTYGPSCCHRNFS